MRQGTECRIEVDGEGLDVVFIGQGLFSRTYRQGERVYLLTKGDYSKECIALFCDKEKKHIPHVSRHAEWKDYQVYSMPFYHKLTKKDYPLAWKQWRTLPSIMRSYDEASRYIDSEQNSSPESIREAIRELIDGFCNYDIDNMMLEFNRANVGVNDRGELILRDCLASRKSIELMRKTKRQKTY